MLEAPIAVGVGELQQPVTFVRGTTHIAQIVLTNLSPMALSLRVTLQSNDNNGYVAFDPVVWTHDLAGAGTTTLQRSVMMNGVAGVDAGVTVIVEDLDYGDAWAFDFDPVTIIGPDVSADLIWANSR